MLVSRWWKCDLQVATPGEPRFKGDPTWDLTTPDGRAAAADDYMVRAKERGLEVLVLADHNSVEWAAEMQAAGIRHGIAVFPGFEVTTASGADGAHLIIFADPASDVEPLRDLLISACGFGPEHPRFLPSQPEHPASSPNTLPQILDKLDDHFLAIAPHAFTDNGIASANTIKGDLRWKALHHDRLAAIDVGYIDYDLESPTPPKASYKERFIRREVDHLPGLKSLPFVSTSDAYRVDELGSQFTWIRMEIPTLEAMRQAFLDYGARIVCDWDPRFKATSRTPNEVTHSWVRNVTITGATSTHEPLQVEFDPRLTVLVGGRGAGKSTVVAALRHLYGDIGALPAQARREAEQMQAAVFPSAALTATHVLPHSGDAQVASWTATHQSQTVRGDGQSTQTEFAVRVISQKELFERAAVGPDGTDTTSRNLLKLVDDALAASGHLALSRFAQQFDEARTTWVTSARKAQTERDAIATRTSVEEAVKELERQVAAFDDEATRARRERNDLAEREAAWVLARQSRLRQALQTLAGHADELLAADPEAQDPPAELSTAARDHGHALEQIKSALQGAIAGRIAEAQSAAGETEASLAATGWTERIRAAKEDSVAYLEELAALGLDPQAYERVRSSLGSKIAELNALERRARDLPDLERQVAQDWAAVSGLLDQRYGDRNELLEAVARRSTMLRFATRRRADLTSWVESVRTLLNLRADGFLEDVPDLARWLWADESMQASRFAEWQNACVSGDFRTIASQASMRPTWTQRLAGLDPLVRVRLAAEIADDAVDMEFLRYDDPTSGDQRWEPLMTGSPGQRSAAMLSFVLHQGVEPLVLDQPEDDLDTEWISELVVQQLRLSRWIRQVIVVTHNANIPVNADAERVVVLENAADSIRVRTTTDELGNEVPHVGALENVFVRADIQRIMEGGVEAFVRRERRYNNEVSSYRRAMRAAEEGQP